MRVLRVSVVSAAERSEDEQRKRQMKQRGEEHTKGETRKLRKREM